ncbi:hypothetical protein EES41_02780 [Streptomyces sp. ADI95-16]|uniref:DUF3040 domain-containing protein n=1 Tax=Streptomyces sp. ADI95-16 TaxID=1522758 RepID=UPI000F3A95D9|nr:hypothetical protein EES41_02780 [Streptomyces sp. ADI95-16]
MDEERALARIERYLARDDPELATRISMLNEQFPQGCVHGRPRRNRRKTAAVLLAIVALLGLVLTALLGRTPPDGNPGRPVGLAPAFSAQSRCPLTPSPYSKGHPCVHVMPRSRTPR